MSTPTEHLGLHQWEAGDSFLRTDFNEDFAKIDAGVKAAHALAGAAKALAEGYCVAGSFDIVAGQEKTLELGFRPKVALFITNGNYHNLTVAMDGICVEATFLPEYNRANVYTYNDHIFFQDNGIRLTQSTYANMSYNQKTYWVAFR